MAGILYQSRLVRATWGAVLVLLVCQFEVVQGQITSGSDTMQRVTGQATRSWTDDTGRYRVEGRLVAINSDHVRIYKSNGHYATVPIDRLSRGDQQLVANVRRAINSTSPDTDSSDYVNIVHIRISKELLARVANYQFNLDFPIQEVINDIPVNGTLRTFAQTHLRMVPNSRHAVLEIPVRGYSWSNTEMDARVAMIYGEGVTSYEKLIRVTLTQDDVQISAGQLRSGSRYSITGISTSFNRLLDRVVRNAVERRAVSQKESFDQESERRERARINREIDRRVQAAARVVNQFVEMSIDAMSKVREALQVQAHMRTTEDQLFVVVKQSLERQSTMPSTAPEIPHDVPFAAQIHTSVIRQSVTEADVVASLKPVLDDFLAKRGGSLDRIEQRIRNGRFDTSWSKDGEWMSVYWHPPEDSDTRTAQK